MIEIVKSNFSSAYNLDPSFLTYGNEVILLENGVQQDDPSAPALFCIIIQSLTHFLKSQLNLWYLDLENIEDDYLDKILHQSTLSRLALNRKEASDLAYRRLNEKILGLIINIK